MRHIPTPVPEKCYQRQTAAGHVKNDPPCLLCLTGRSVRSWLPAFPALRLPPHYGQVSLKLPPPPPCSTLTPGQGLAVSGGLLEEVRQTARDCQRLPETAQSLDLASLAGSLPPSTAFLCYPHQREWGVASARLPPAA